MWVYLKLWWFQHQARSWGRRTFNARTAMVVAETHMLHYKREWERLRERTVGYQTPDERTAADSIRDEAISRSMRDMLRNTPQEPPR